MISDILKDATLGTTAPAKAALVRIAALVAARNAAEGAMERAEAEFKRRKAQLFQIESVDLPELLRESGLTEAKLEDGTKVVIRDEISCSISEERREAAHAWLRERGFGALIKNIVSVAFGKGEEAKATAAFAQFGKVYGRDAVEQKESVHAATLKSFIKERIAAVGADKTQAANVPPYALFGVEPYSIAKVTTPKEK